MLLVTDLPKAVDPILFRGMEHREELIFDDEWCLESYSLNSIYKEPEVANKVLNMFANERRIIHSGCIVAPI